MREYRFCSWLLAVLVLGLGVHVCSAPPEEDADGGPAEAAHGPRLIWREDGATALADVPTPEGFAVTPPQVVRKFISVIRRSSSSDLVIYLFADTKLYYIGIARKGKDFPSTPPDNAKKYDGRTGDPAPRNHR